MSTNMVPQPWWAPFSFSFSHPPVCHCGSVKFVGHMAHRWAYLKGCSVMSEKTHPPPLFFDNMNIPPPKYTSSHPRGLRMECLTLTHGSFGNPCELSGLHRDWARTGQGLQVDPMRSHQPNVQFPVHLQSSPH